jgi:hypothetical protein
MTINEQWGTQQSGPFKLTDYRSIYRSMNKSRLAAIPETTLTQTSIGRQLVSVGRHLLATTQDAEELCATKEVLASLTRDVTSLLLQVQSAEKSSNEAD